MGPLDRGLGHEGGPDGTRQQVQHVTGFRTHEDSGKTDSRESWYGVLVGDVGVERTLSVGYLPVQTDRVVRRVVREVEPPPLQEGSGRLPQGRCQGLHVHRVE